MSGLIWIQTVWHSDCIPEIFSFSKKKKDNLEKISRQQNAWKITQYAKSKIQWEYMHRKIPLTSSGIFECHSSANLTHSFSTKTFSEPVKQKIGYFTFHISQHRWVQWLSSRSLVRALTMALCCVLDWFNLGKTSWHDWKIAEWNVKHQLMQTNKHLTTIMHFLYLIKWKLFIVTFFITAKLFTL